MMGKSKKQYPPSAIELAGQRAWNEAWSYHRTSSRRSFITAIVGVTVGGAGVGFACWRSAQPQAVPVLVNRDGPLVETARLVATMPDANRISGHLATWVAGFRTVVVDAAYQKHLAEQTYAWTDGSSVAIDKLNGWYVTHKPADRAKTETVEVEIATAPIPQGGAVWQVDWKETAWAREQGKIPQISYWRMIVTVKIQLPETDAEIKANWDGVFVQDFSFRQVGVNS
jgi:type IV secretion system protein TrbF